MTTMYVKTPGRWAIKEGTDTDQATFPVLVVGATPADPNPDCYRLDPEAVTYLLDQLAPWATGITVPTSWPTVITDDGGAMAHGDQHAGRIAKATVAGDTTARNTAITDAANDDPATTGATLHILADLFVIAVRTIVALSADGAGVDLNPEQTRAEIVTLATYFINERHLLL